MMKDEMKQKQTLTNEAVDRNRRELLKMMKKAAIYTPPAIATLLLVSREKAHAS